ncbi:uncharacterized protein LOC128574089 isoform X10 [Nycticebus coucang]|uniref:uncharacterized protein LOC128574089 isoform X10 n=1 Tax=Nycticebus coucang TaxID=9470 RepID=UPI00234E1DB5|nr:uncharacterized protein LOC128574089 isoform X10 [Nycticebus coucang]
MIGAGAPCTCPACLPCTCHPHLPGDSVLQTCRWATHCMGAPSQPEGAAGQTRISLISPPQDGHVGSISYRGPQNLSLTPNQSMAKPLRDEVLLCCLFGLKVLLSSDPPSLASQTPGITYMSYHI